MVNYFLINLKEQRSGPEHILRLLFCVLGVMMCEGSECLWARTWSASKQTQGPSALQRCLGTRHLLLLPHPAPQLSCRHMFFYHEISFPKRASYSISCCSVTPLKVLLVDSPVQILTLHPSKVKVSLKMPVTTFFFYPQSCSAIV